MVHKRLSLGNQKGMELGAGRWGRGRGAERKKVSFAGIYCFIILLKSCKNYFANKFSCANNAELGGHDQGGFSYDDLPKKGELRYSIEKETSTLPPLFPRYRLLLVVNRK